jgi:hypothetical protein
MKDALGHGSGERGGLMGGFGGFPPTRGHAADLRNRLSAPKQGLLHSFAQGLKNALSGADKDRHAAHNAKVLSDARRRYGAGPD